MYIPYGTKLLLIYCSHFDIFSNSIFATHKNFSSIYFLFTAVNLSFPLFYNKIHNSFAQGFN